eukprot:4534609-Pleurochrysis_carterae.AAC.8
MAAQSIAVLAYSYSFSMQNEYLLIRQTLCASAVRCDKITVRLKLRYIPSDEVTRWHSSIGLRAH